MSQQIIKVKGKLLHIGKPRYWGDDKSNYATKIYIDTDPTTEYPSQVELEVYKDRIDLSKFKAGDEVEVSINFKGATREWNGKNKFFQSIDAWKMELASAPASTYNPPNEEDDEDSLPF